MIETKVSKQELAKATKKLRDLRLKKLKDLSTPMAKVSVMLDSWVQRNFKTEGASTGSAWPAIGRETRNGFEKGRDVPNFGWDSNAKILQDTGRLRSSFLPFYTKKDAGIGSDLPYSEAHEEGKGVKKRRMLPKKSEVWSAAKKIIAAYIKKVSK